MMWPIYVFIGFVACLWAYLEWRVWQYSVEMKERQAEIKSRKARLSRGNMDKGVSIREIYDWDDEWRVTK